MSKSESSGNISRDKELWILFLSLAAIFVLLAQVSGYADAALATGLAFVGWAGYQHQQTLSLMLDVTTTHREEINRHSEALNILLDERGRSRVERREEWRRPQ